jgi:hypothetical protein
MSRFSLLRLCEGAAVCSLVAISMATAAHADGILGVFLNAVNNAVVASSWQNVDAGTQNCLISQYNINPQAEIQAGIPATDPTVMSDIQQCQQSMQAQAQPPQAQPSEAGAEEQNEAAQRQRLADLQAHSKMLIAKYGRKHASQILNGNIDYGMRAEEVELAWGDPEEKDDDTPTHGKSSWKYGNDVVVFTAGRVTDVTH